MKPAFPADDTPKALDFSEKFFPGTGDESYQAPVTTVPPQSNGDLPQSFKSTFSLKVRPGVTIHL